MAKKLKHEKRTFEDDLATVIEACTCMGAKLYKGGDALRRLAKKLKHGKITYEDDLATVIENKNYKIAIHDEFVVIRSRQNNNDLCVFLYSSGGIEVTKGETFVRM